MNQWIKVIKIAVGSTVAILLAYALGLSYALAAGIITLLTIQDTKKETVVVLLKRAGAFVFMVILVMFIFRIFSYTPVSYGIFLLFFVGSCYFLKMSDAIPMNAVLATHFFLEKNTEFVLLQNEVLLFVIGTGIGTLMNLYIPSNVAKIRKEQTVIEEDIRLLLSRMSEKLLVEDKTDYTDQCFVSLENHIAMGIGHAYTNMNNSLFQESRYYIEYMEMRKQQCRILREMYEKIVTLHSVPAQAGIVSVFLKEISESLSESQNAKDLLAREEGLLLQLKESSLPESRNEFEERAVLYMVLKDICVFLKMKEGFAESLTEEQKLRYWEKGE